MTPRFDPLRLCSVSFATLRDDLATVLNLLVYRDQGFLVTRRGAPCAVLLPLAAAEKLGLDLQDTQVYEAR